MIGKFIIKIKRRENWFFKFIYNSVLAFRSIHIPVNSLTKPVYLFLYNFHVMLRTFIYWFFRFFYIEPLFKSRCSSVGKNVRIEKLPFIMGNGEIHLGDKVIFSGKPSIFFHNRIFSSPQLIIGNETFISHQTSFIIAKQIKIGSHCLIGGRVFIIDNNSHPLDWKERMQGLPISTDDIKPVIIGNHVMIYTDATILSGVTIGDRSIIATKAVVTADVPSDCIVAGNPAKIVKFIKDNQP